MLPSPTARWTGLNCCPGSPPRHPLHPGRSGDASRSAATFLLRRTAISSRNDLPRGYLDGLASRPPPRYVRVAAGCSPIGKVLAVEVGVLVEGEQRRP